MQLLVSSPPSRTNDLTGVIKPMLKKILSDDKYYQPNSVLWTMGASSSPGDFHGFLQPLISAIGPIDGVGAVYLPLLEAQKGNPNSQLIAHGISLALASSNQASALDVEQQMEKLIQLDDEAGRGSLPYQFWWQLGDNLEDGGFHVQSVRAVERASELIAPGQSTARQNRFSAAMQARSYNDVSYLTTKLTRLRVAAGQVVKAREGIMRSFQQSKLQRVDPSRINPSVSLVEIRMRQAFIRRLKTLGGTLEAIQICSETLADTRLFSTVSRLSTTTPFRQQFERELKSCLTRLRESDCERFLSGGSSDDVQSSESPKIIPLPPSKKTGIQVTSVAAIVIAELAKASDGRQRLLALDKEYAVRQLGRGSNPADPNVSGLRALVHLELKTEDRAGLLQDMLAIIPQPNANSQEQVDDVLALYSPVMVGLESSDQTVAQAAAEVSSKLISIANRNGRADIARALLQKRLVKLDFSESPEEVKDTLAGMLDSIKLKANEAKISSFAVVDSCLEVAELAAKHGAWEIVFEAIQRGFAGGITQRVVTTTAVPNPFGARFIGGDPFGEPPAPRISAQSLSVRLRALLKKYREDGAGSADPAAYVALRLTVMPMSVEKYIHPFCASVLGDKSIAMSKKPKLDQFSVSDELARVAVKLDQADKVAKELKSRSSSSPHIANMILAQLAIHSQDDDAIVESLKRLLGPMATYLSEDTSKPVNRIRSLLEVGEPYEIADSALQVSLALHQLESKSTDVAQHHMKLDRYLLAVAARDTNTSRASGLWTWMTKGILLSHEVSESDADQAIDLYLAATKRRNTKLATTAAAEDYGRQSIRVLRSAILGQRWSSAARLLRTFGKHRTGLRNKGNDFSFLSLDLIDVKPEVRFELLRAMIEGPQNEGVAEAVGSETARLYSCGGYALYANPPPTLRMAVPFLGNARKIPVASRRFPITSTALQIAEVASEIGKKDELIQVLRRCSRESGDEAEAMIGLAQLADHRYDLALETLQRIAESLRQKVESEAKVSIGSDTRVPVRLDTALFIVRCLQHQGLRSKAEEAWAIYMRQVDSLSSGQLGLSASFFYQISTDIERATTAADTLSAQFVHWTAVQTPSAGTPMFAATQPMYDYQNGALRMSAGSNQNVLMLKYPLKGDFRISFKIHPQPKGETGVFYGGTEYSPRAEEGKILVRSLVDRSHVSVAGDLAKAGQESRYQLFVAQQRVQFNVNNLFALFDDHSSTMPFFGVVHHANARARVSELTLGGAPEIAKEVDLIGQQLRGWSCPILSGKILPAHLPISEGQIAEKVKRERDKAHASAASKTTWYFADGQLKTGKVVPKDNLGGQRHIQYGRPLLKGESISFDFRFDDSTYAVHPTVGRVAVLIRKDGLKLRWLRQKPSLESFQSDSLNEVAIDEMLGEMPQLSAKDNNTMKITAGEKVYRVEINGHAVAQFQGALDRRFGLLCESGKECVVSNLKLTGPWPDALPKELLKTVSSDRR